MIRRIPSRMLTDILRSMSIEESIVVRDCWADSFRCRSWQLGIQLCEHGFWKNGRYLHLFIRIR